jgi:hypothetical protein
MEQHKTAESANFLARAITVAVAIVVGLMAKYSYELSKGRKLSILAWVGITGLSVFTGYMASVICDYYHSYDASKIIVPLATLFGEKIIEFLFLKFSFVVTQWLKSVLSSLFSAVNKDMKE